MGRLPVWQLTGLQLEWLREKTQPTARSASIGSVLTWDEETQYDKLMKTLSEVYKQTRLDKFLPSVYGTYNNYRNIQALEDHKAVINTMEDLFIYGDNTFSAGNLEPDGLHALAYAGRTPLGQSTNALNIDEGGALSVFNLRLLIDSMRYGVDMLLTSPAIGRRLDAYAQEQGVSTFTASQINIGMDDLGQHVRMWEGIPIVRSDYMVAEEAGTGEGSDAMAKNTGTAEYTIFAIKFGQVIRKEPGLTFVFGGENFKDGEPIQLTHFDKLENYNAEGLRQMVYMALADGSKMAIGRIYGITDGNVTA